MRTYRAAPSSYAVFASIAGAMGVLWLVATWRTETSWLPLSLPAALLVASVLWLSRFRVTIDKDGVTLREPLRPLRRLARADIVSVELGEELGRSRSPMTLCIRTSDGEELRLNARVFAGEAIEQLLALNAPARRRAA